MPNNECDINAILDSCFAEFSKTNTVKRGIVLENKRDNIVDIWQIDTEVDILNLSRDISYYIHFKKSFPYSLPKLYLVSCDYELGYIPHLEESKSICLYEGQVSYNIDDPIQIIKTCIDKANKTIKDGAEGNNALDFAEEILAYWEMRYNLEPEPLFTEIIHSFTVVPVENTTVLILPVVPKNEFGHKYIVSENESNSLFEYHLQNGSSINNIVDGLYIADFSIKLVPPYSIKYSEFEDLLTTQSQKDFRKYINSKKQNKKIILFPINSSGLVGGIVCNLKMPRKGFRAMPNSQLLSGLYKNRYFQRLLSREYSNNRIEKRTSGNMGEKYKFIIAGVGSVGSHLTYFLNNINYPELTFVDNDLLSIDNIGRHMLGYSDINQPKSVAMSNYLRGIRPDQSTKYYMDSIEDVIIDNIGVVNSHDYLFVVVGHKMTEDFIIESIKQNKITIPVFIIWVEAYLASGQCVYIKPKDAAKYKSLYDAEMLYNHHVISKSEYCKEESLIFKKDAGCGSSYSPYSSNDVVLFLSALYPYINKVIAGEINDSFRYSWVGDIKRLLDLGIVTDVAVSESNTQKIEVL